MSDRPSLMLTSERLRFETWLQEDFDSLFELHTDPRVQRSYVFDPHKWTIEGLNRRLVGYMEEQEKMGFTKWKLSLQNGTFIGRAGWSRWDRKTLEIGYALKPQHWHNGYASEAARALADWAREHQAHDTLVGFALPHNVASRRVLTGMGMRFVDYRMIGRADHAYYEL